MEARVELRIFCFDTTINCLLCQKFKLLGNGEINHLSVILTKGKEEASRSLTLASLFTAS